ncbi:MAG TPA: MraY family glycosyltransferase [Prolixibacteraceae bacterium]
MREFVYVLASFLIALGVTYRAIPTVISVSQQLKLFSEPNGRSASNHKVPTLGGVAIFIGFVLGLTLTRNGYILPGLSFIIAAVMIMFFVGLKDDIVSLSATKKIFSQLIVAGILIFLGHFRFTNLHGFLGIEEIPAIASIPLTAFAMIVFINAFNLIDGIDGLAAGLSIFSASVFGVWFFLSGHFEYSIVSFSLVGALLGFFFFNVYGKKNKIFMGDTGSLILGTIMAVLVIEFNEFNIDQSVPYKVLAAPAVAFGIMIYPLMDTLRVFVIRIVQRKSPFNADKNHTHHRLLIMGMTHARATYLILFVNAVFTFAVFYFQWIGIIGLMTFNFIFGGALLLIPSYIVGKKKLIKPNDPYQEVIFFGDNQSNGHSLNSSQKPAEIPS